MAQFAPFNYLKTTVDEGRKVVWPNRETVVRHTVMVVVSVAVAVLIFASLDYGLKKLVILAIER